MNYTSQVFELQNNNLIWYFITPDIKLNYSVKINIVFILKVYSRIEMHLYTVVNYFCF